MKKTEKNKITISGMASVEDILMVIGAHLETIEENYGAIGFCDIGFYFNSYNGIQKFTLSDDKGLEKYEYAGGKVVKSVRNKKELDTENKLSIDNLQRRILSFKEKLKNIREENIKKQNAEKERREQDRIESEIRHNKWLLKCKEQEAILEINRATIAKIKKEFIEENSIKDSKGLKVWAVNTLPTLEKHMAELNRLEELDGKDIQFPVYIVIFKDNKYVYFV